MQTPTTWILSYYTYIQGFVRKPPHLGAKMKRPDLRDGPFLFFEGALENA